MKTRYLFSALAVLSLLAVGCVEKLPGDLAEIQVDNSYVSIPETGGTNTVNVTCSQAWQIFTDENNTIPGWLTVSPMSGSGNGTITFSAEKSVSYREATVKIVVGDRTQHLTVAQGVNAVTEATCAEVLAGPDGKTYIAEGTCVSIANTQYGNWYLEDATGRIYIYGTVNGEGKYDWANFGIEEGDIVKVKGPKTTYNGTVELVDVKVISVTKSLVQVTALPEGEIAKEGGDAEVRLVSKGGNIAVEIPADAKAWLSMSNIKVIPGVPDPSFPTIAVPDTTVITFRALANELGARSTTVSFSSSANGHTSTVTAEINQEGAIIDSSVKDFLAAEVGSVMYRLTGVISRLYASDKQGQSFYIKDWSGEVLVYRTDNFKESALQVGDVVSVVGTRGEYKGTAQMVSGHVEAIVALVDEISLAEFLTKADSKDNYYMVTGTISSLKDDKGKDNDYGNMYITDGTNTVYVYGCYPGWGATGDARKGLVKDNNLEVGDEITIIATKSSYNDVPQLNKGVCFSFKKANE